MLAVVFSSAMACVWGRDLASQCLPGLQFPENVPWQSLGMLILLQHSWLCLTEKYNSCRYCIAICAQSAHGLWLPRVIQPKFALGMVLARASWEKAGVCCCVSSVLEQ